MEYETVVCDEMPMFPVKMVSLLQPSNPDLIMNELPAVAVEELLSAYVDTPRIALQCYLVRPDLSGIDYSCSQPRQLLPGENENRLLHSKVYILGNLSQPKNLFAHMNTLGQRQTLQ